MQATQVMAACLIAAAMQTASADPSRDGPVRPTTIARTRQPVGTPHNSSSFAPHRGGKRHAYGAPLQGRIMGKVKPKQPPKPK
jgi:hypothetical protein